MATSSSNTSLSATSPQERRHQARYVRLLFASIATHYDRLNRLISFGQDQAWRRVAVLQCALPTEGRLLDAVSYTHLRAHET